MATYHAVMMCVQGCAKLPGLAQFKLPHQPYNYLEKVSCSAADVATITAHLFLSQAALLHHDMQMFYDCITSFA